ncbi:hypothetical protein C8R45DRAFT_183268 [Mycena sanguinolenta]|nr:hypothetical protein C8R45DRAFT_183268 [Mycena sanguinolenta]
MPATRPTPTSGTQMDSGMQAWSLYSASQPHPAVGHNLDGHTSAPSGVVDSNGGLVDPTQLVALGDAYNANFTFTPTPPFHEASDYAHEHLDVVGSNPLPTRPFVLSDHVQAPRVSSTRSSPDEARHRTIAQFPSVQHWFLRWLLNMARLREMHVREIHRYIASQTADEFVASVREAERLDPRRPRARPPFSPSIPSHSSRSSTRNSTSTTIGHGVEIPPALAQTQAYAMGGYQPSPNDATRASFTDPNCGPQHDAEQQRYMLSYQTDVSPFPQAVVTVGPASNSPPNRSTALPSSAANKLAWGSPSHTSAPNAPVLPPAPGVSWADLTHPPSSYQHSAHFNDAMLVVSHTASTSSMTSNSAATVSPQSFGYPDCVPEQRYMSSYHTDVSPFTVVGPYSNSPQIHSTTLRSSAPSALALELPLHPSTPDAPASLPAPRECAICHKTDTSQWRRHPKSGADLCNYCGQKAYKAAKGVQARMK